MPSRCRQEHPQHTGTVADGALGKSGAGALDGKRAQDRRRELLDRANTDPP